MLKPKNLFYILKELNGSLFMISKFTSYTEHSKKQYYVDFGLFIKL